MSSIRDALRSELAKLHTPAQHRQAEAELHALADEQGRLAAALQRQQEKPPAQRHTSHGGRVATEQYITLLIRQPAGRHADEQRLTLSRALYYATRPTRLRVRRDNDQLLLEPCGERQGYAVVVTRGGVWINVSGVRDIIALDAGRYAATVRGDGAIVVGERLHAD